MFKFNEKTKKNIQKNTGLAVEQISIMDEDELDRALEKKIGKKLQFKLLDNPWLIGRGSVYLALNRLIPTNQIDEKIKKI